AGVRAGHFPGYVVRRLRARGDPDANSVDIERRIGIFPHGGLTPILHFNSEGHKCVPPPVRGGVAADTGEAGDVRRCGRRRRSDDSVAAELAVTNSHAVSTHATTDEAVEVRSEERREGKEWRARWWTDRGTTNV